MLGVGYAVFQNHVKNIEIKRLQILNDKKAFGKIEKPIRPAEPSAPPPEKSEDRKLGAEIEIFSILRVKLDDSDDWTLVFKMLILTLGTFLGIRFINFGFRKFG